MASYFDNAAWARRTLTPLDEVDALFDNRQNHFAEIESRSEQLHAQLTRGFRGKSFAAAQSLVEKRLEKVLRKIVANESGWKPISLAGAPTISLLVRYAAGAVIVPLEPVSGGARRTLNLRYRNAEQ